MTLHHVYEQVAPTFPTSMRKDLKTAVQILSHVLQYADPQNCPLEACLQPLPTLTKLVDIHLQAQGKGPYTVRNTKNLISRFFREANAKDLLTLPLSTVTPRFSWEDRPPRPGSEGSRRDGTHLHFEDWPFPLQQDFADFYTWTTQHVVDGREARLRKRQTTLDSYRHQYEMYFGFLFHVRGERRLTFDHLFDFPRLKAFFEWHINVKHHRVTRTAHMFLERLLALTRQYRPQPALRAQLQALRRTLPQPAPTYEKSHAWVPLETQERIGRAIWPQVSHRSLRHSGQRHAVRAGMSLALRLWVRIPYRSRNMREMRLRQNLYRDPHGIWRIRFAGEELKIATRKGHPNVFDLPLPTDLTPTLEDYLEHWRPRLAFRRPAPQEVFLRMCGKPYGESQLRATTRGIMYRYTGRYWHPHIVRTVWATEYIRATGDYYGAAIMLNDTLEVVIRTYAHLRDENIADKAYQWVQAQIIPGARP